MLVSLHVKNLALIREMEVFFGPGLNILTGETGAGKSVVLGSVALALGAKADRDMIRTGADYALVELTFSVSEEERAAVEALEIPAEDGTVVLQRRIMPARSLSRVNGETVSARVLKELAGILIDIHGQHDSQMLLQTRRHLEILDDYGGGRLAEEKRRVRKAHGAYSALAKEIGENELDEPSRRRELSLARFEAEEIAAAGLMAGEDERLEKDYRRMVNGRRIAESLNAVHALTGYDSGTGAGEATGRALRELAGILSYDEKLEDFYSQLNDADALLNDFNRSVSEYLSEMEFDGPAFERTEERLNCINRFKEKYGRTIPEILAYGKRREEEILRLENQDAWLEEKRAALERAEKEMRLAAAELTRLRQGAADSLTRELKEALSDLNFLHVEFAVSLTQRESCSADGTDDAVFLISTNPGEPLKPLSAIASGGELSRIMLALKTVTAKQEKGKTFIFDEIDAGISGKTAWKVSGKLGLLARTHQIICITHLSQIAAMADTHFYIEKNAVEDKTATSIRELSEEERLQELARLSGAAQITESVLQNAREMKELAEKNK